MKWFAAIGISALVLTACGTEQQVNPQSSPSPNVLDNAIEATAARGTAVVTVEIVSDLETLTGVGSTSLTTGRGQVTWTNSVTGEIVTELNTKDGLYSEIDGTWFLAPPGTLTPTSTAINPLNGLGDLKSPTSDPLVGTLPLTIESGLNFSEEDLISLPAECSPVVDVQIQVDSSGLITQVTKEFECEGNQRVSVINLTEFGTALDLAEPVDAIEVPGNQ